MLAGVWRLSGEIDQFGGLGAPYPVRHFDVFQMDFEPEAPHLIRHVLRALH